MIDALISGKLYGQPTERTTPLGGREAVTLEELALAAYETQRPAPEAACREGDARFFPVTGH